MGEVIARVRLGVLAMAVLGTVAGAGRGEAQGATRGGAESKTEFSVVSIRPSAPGGQLSFDVTDQGFRARSTPLFWILLQAYCPLPMAYWRGDLVTHAPAWVRTQPFDVDARLEEEEAKSFAKLTPEEQAEELRPKLQTLLQERFGLQVHTLMETSPVWKLSETSKARLTPAVAGAAPESAVAVGDGAFLVHLPLSDGRHGVRLYNITMKKFAEVLSGFATEDEPPIVDATQREGRYDLVLFKREGETLAEGGNVPPAAMRWDLRALGLELKRGRAELPTLVLERVHEPTEN